MGGGLGGGQVGVGKWKGRAKRKGIEYVRRCGGKRKG